MLYAVNKGPETIIYVSDSANDETNIYETTMSAIKRVNENIYKEIIKNYREESHMLDVYKLEKYASLYSNKDKLLEILQLEVF